MWRRKATGVAALAIGAVLIIAALVDHEVIASKNALCQSPIGQIGSAIDNTVAHDCGLVTALESAVGWLIAVGVIGLILGIVVIRNSRAVPQPAAAPAPWSAAPPAPWSAGPPPPGPASPAMPWSAGPPPPSPAAPTGPWPVPPASPGPVAPPAPGPASAPADRPWWNQT
jgi:hypothetical protein